MAGELKKMIGNDKIKQNFSSFEFTLNSLTCIFYLTDEKIVFNQVFVTDPSGKAFGSKGKLKRKMIWKHW